MSEDVKNHAEPSAAESPYTTLTPETREAWNKEIQQPKSEATASSDAPKAAKSEGKPESAPAPEAGKEPQEKTSKKLTADERIAQLEATIEKIKKAAGKETKQATETKPAEPSPAKPVEVKAEPAPKLEPPKEPSIEDPKYQGEDGWKKYEADIRQYTRDLAKYEAAIASQEAVEKYKREQQNAQELARVQQQIKNGREKYGQEEFDKRADPVIQAFSADLNHPVSQAIGTSPVFEHLIYTIGGEAQEFIALAQSNPLAAVKRVGVLEALIMEELKAKPAEKSEAKEPKEEKKPPVETVTRAPKPPSEVGGRATTADDEGQQAAKSGDFRAAKAAWTRDYVASNK